MHRSGISRPVGLSLVAVAALAAAPAFASDNPWIGSWKLDKAKSHFTGQTFTYTKQANGLDRYDDGATSYEFTANGLDYPVMGGVMESWKADGDNKWTYTDKLNGKTLSTTEVELSKDGKTLKTVTTGTRPDGSNIHDENTYTKTKGEGGLEGTWKSVKVNISAPGAWIVSQGSSPDEWKWDIPDWKETVVGKPDGSDLKINGPAVAEGMTVAIKQQGPRKLLYEVKNNGKTMAKGEQTLAPNGKSFTDVGWTPGKENEKQTSFYARQP